MNSNVGKHFNMKVNVGNMYNAREHCNTEIPTQESTAMLEGFHLKQYRKVVSFGIALQSWNSMRWHCNVERFQYEKVV